ncbi:MAG: hypothetical protein HYY46_11750 [Deltaproteobacteria bacterium]|nr:hypothetical protein [Deltaproteobacteria bacterium]MBI2999099.1 hypothetical protein [Deltaproteobacteria bacterium]
MDVTQEQHERAVADSFVEFYNRENGTDYRYHSRGEDPPDLIYRSGSHEMRLEITAAYYDTENAAMLWQNARGVPGARDIWISKSPDVKLIESINSTLAKKCVKRYPSGWVLLVDLYPDLVTAEEFADLISEIQVPAGHPFAEIYVAGVFPASSSGSRGGYHCWKLA